MRVPSGPPWPRAIILPSYCVHLLCSPLISSLTLTRLGLRKVQTGWWLSRLWLVPLSLSSTRLLSSSESSLFFTLCLIASTSVLSPHPTPPWSHIICVSSFYSPQFDSFCFISRFLPSNPAILHLSFLISLTLRVCALLTLISLTLIVLIYSTSSFPCALVNWSIFFHLFIHYHLSGSPSLLAYRARGRVHPRQVTSPTQGQHIRR